MTSTPPLAMIVPATPSLPSTAPPFTPWLLAIKRVILPILALLPFLFDALVQLVNVGTVQIPPQYASLWAALLIALQLYNKARVEQQRQAAGQELSDIHGLPVGQPLPATALRNALYTSSTLAPGTSGQL